MIKTSIVHPTIITKILSGLLFGYFSGLACAETLYGKVVGVSDGDTVTLLTPNNTQYKIRLSGIDAPERKQPFGEQSKLHISELAFGKNAQATCHKKDRYGRYVCAVNVGGVDVGLAQIRAGLSWWYHQYAREQPMQDQVSYSEAEDDAKLKRIGLWKDSSPIPPWEWRHNKKVR